MATRSSEADKPIEKMRFCPKLSIAREYCVRSAASW